MNTVAERSKDLMLTMGTMDAMKTIAKCAMTPCNGQVDAHLLAEFFAATQVIANGAAEQARTIEHTGLAGRIVDKLLGRKSTEPVHHVRTLDETIDVRN